MFTGHDNVIKNRFYCHQIQDEALFIHRSICILKFSCICICICISISFCICICICICLCCYVSVSSFTVAFVAVVVISAKSKSQSQSQSESESEPKQMLMLMMIMLMIMVESALASVDNDGKTTELSTANWTNLSRTRSTVKRVTIRRARFAMVNKAHRLPDYMLYTWLYQIGNWRDETSRLCAAVFRLA